MCFYYKDDINLDVQDFKEKLGAILPYYMIPSHFMKIDEIPLPPNNKVNKKALPKPKKEVYSVEYVAPTDEMEKKLCDVFARNRDQEVLKKISSRWVEIHSNFGTDK